MRLQLQAAGKSDIGCVRSNNEDNFGLDVSRGIFVVCDGMGGMASGELASTLGVESILDYFRRQGRDAPGQENGRGENPGAAELAEALQQANQVIYERASEEQERSGMGAAVVAVRCEGRSFSVGHVGDSRVYLIRQGSIRQLTNDHSVVMEQVRLGLLTMEEAKVSRMQNLITRALGAREKVEPDLSTHAATSGDVLLLCTDGLSRYVSDDKLLEIIAGAEDLEACCDLLIQTAKDSDSDDNITCVLLRFAEASGSGGGVPSQKTGK